MKKTTSADQLAQLLHIPKGRSLEALVKARLIAAVVREIERTGLTHAQIALRSGHATQWRDRHSLGKPAEGDD